MPLAVRPVLVAAILLGACSRPEPDPGPPPAPSEPWPAQASSSTQRSQRIRFVVLPRGEATFELKTRKATHTGAVRVARGELDIDLLNLAATRGHIEMDLTSVRMLDEEGADDRQASSRAQNWLDLGSSRPRAAREGVRWARFTIESVSDLSAEAAYEGRLEKSNRPTHDAGTPDAGTIERGEVRTVTLKMRGKLRLHDYEVVQVGHLRVSFHYAARATAGAVPTRVVLATRKTFPVGLAAHDIRPRDDHGSVIAQEMKLLGSEVAREARVSFTIEASPTPQNVQE